MFNHELYATSLARAVDVMKHFDAKEQQKGALRALVALCATESATVRRYDGQLSIDDVGISDELPHVGTLAGRMAAHGISEISVGRGAEPAELLAMLRGLADNASGPSVKDRLRDAKSTRIWVLLTDIDEPGPGKRTSVSNLFDPEPPAPVVPDQKPQSRRSAAKIEEEEALAAWDDLHSPGGNTSAMKEIDLGIVFDDAPQAAAAPVPEPEQGPLPELPIAADTRLGAALMALARRPRESGVLDRLTTLADAVNAALASGQIEDALLALAMIVRFEPEAPEGSPRNSYRITLTRLLSRETLVQLAPYAAEPRLADDTGAVFARAGGAATEVLLGLLATAESSRDRRGLMRTLRGIPTGHDQIIQMLGHHQWFVARNVAELVGEMRLEAAVDALDAMLEHKDQRVRRAAAMALIRIGTPAVVDPLQRAMGKGVPEMRALVATLIGSGQGSMFTTPIAVQLETEEDPDVLRELCLALSRIGTDDAVQALERARKSGGLFSRRARALKEAAEQALQRSRRT